VGELEWDAVVGAVGGVARAGWVGVAVGETDGTIGDVGGRSARIGLICQRTFLRM
jgi:hypothetical protein